MEKEAHIYVLNVPKSDFFRDDYLYAAKQHAICGCKPGTEYYQRSDNTFAEGFEFTDFGKSYNDITPPMKDGSVAMKDKSGNTFPANNGANFECTTCNNQPADNPTNVQSKFNCLYDWYTKSATQVPSNIAAQLKTKLASNIIILSELHGHWLNASSLKNARKMFNNHPGVVPVNAGNVKCGVNPEIPSCAMTPSPSPDFKSRIMRCQRLLSSHVALETRDVEAGVCMSLLEEMAAFSEDACTDQYQQTIVDLVDQYLEKLFDEFESRIKSDANSLQAKAAWILGHVIVWYNKYCALVSDEELDQSLYEMIGEFWKRIDNGRNLLNEVDTAIAPVKDPNLTPSEVEAKLNDPILQSNVVNALNKAIILGMSLDQAVLKAAFAKQNGRQILSDLVMLAVLGELLNTYADRIDMQSASHDVACMLKPCKLSGDSGSIYTNVSQAWHVLANIDNLAGLTAALEKAQDDMQGWKVAFEVVKDEFTFLDNAIKNVMGQNYDPEDLSDLDLESTPNSARKFFEAVRNAKVRDKSYAASGLFKLSSGKYLVTGSNWEKREEIKAKIEQKLPSFERSLAQYGYDIARLVWDMVMDIDNQQTIDRMNLRRNDLIEEFERLDERRNAYVSTYTDSIFWANTVKAFIGTQGAFQGTKYFNIRSDAVRYIYAKDAKFTGGYPSTIADLTNQAPISLTTGQILSIHTTGQWAPTCAMRVKEILHPNENTSSTIDVNGVLTGPEGYNVLWTGSSYQAQSNPGSKGTTIEFGARTELCSGSGGLAQYFVGLSIDACLYHNRAFRDSDVNIWDKGTYSRTTTTFYPGLYLDNTPILAPAGGLLVVEMKKGQSHLDFVRDIHLVRAPYSSIAVSEDSDMYLVVNDIVNAEHCPQPDGQNKLEVQMQVMQSEIEVSRQLLSRIALVLDSIRAKEKEYVKRGEIFASEIAMIRNEARISDPEGLDHQGPAIPVDQYPAALGDLYETFLTSELARLERTVRLSNLDYERDLLVHEINSIRYDIEYAEQSGILLKLLPRWGIRNLEIDHLYRHGLRLDEVLVDLVFPLLELWNSGVLSEMGGNQYVNRLLNQQLGFSIKELSQDLIDLTGDLVNSHAWRNSIYGNRATVMSTVAVSFRRPDTSVEKAFAGASGYEEGGFVSMTAPDGSPYSDFTPVDAARAKAVWDALESNGVAEITIYPSDIYHLTGGDSQLPCGSELPVLRQVGFAIVRPNGVVVPGSHRQADAGNVDTLQLASFGRAGRDQLFVRFFGPESYQLTNSKWINIDAPVVYTGHDDARYMVQAALNTGSQEVIGLSPFASLYFPFPTSVVFPNADLLGATEFVVIMDLESVSAGVNGMNWIPECN